MELCLKFVLHCALTRVFTCICEKHTQKREYPAGFSVLRLQPQEEEEGPSFQESCNHKINVPYAMSVGCSTEMSYLRFTDYRTALLDHATYSCRSD